MNVHTGVFANKGVQWSQHRILCHFSQRKSLALTSESFILKESALSDLINEKDESGHKMNFDKLQPGLPRGTLHPQLQVPADSSDPGLGPGPENRVPFQLL